MLCMHVCIALQQVCEYACLPVVLCAFFKSFIFFLLSTIIGIVKVWKNSVRRFSWDVFTCENIESY